MDTIQLEEIVGVFCILSGAANAGVLIDSGKAAEWCQTAAEWFQMVQMTEEAVGEATEEN